LQNSIGETLYRELEQVAYELIEFLDPNKDLELIKKIESRIDYWAEGNGLFFGWLFCSSNLEIYEPGRSGSLRPKIN